MTELTIEQQILALDRKMDMILGRLEQQGRNREEFDDLMDDLGIVAKDAFRHTVTILDKSQIDLDHAGIPMLLIKILQNIGTFREMLELMESARDFMKDVSPILHQVGLDAVNKMNELEQKGYFAWAAEMMRFMDRFITTFTAEDLKNLGDNLEHITAILRNLTRPDLMKGLESVSTALTSVSMDDRLDNRSLFGLLKQLNSPGVRKSVSYMLRVVQEAENGRGK